MLFIVCKTIMIVLTVSSSHCQDNLIVLPILEATAKTILRCLSAVYCLAPLMNCLTAVIYACKAIVFLFPCFEFVLPKLYCLIYLYLSCLSNVLQVHMVAYIYGFPFFISSVHHFVIQSICKAFKLFVTCLIVISTVFCALITRLF